MISDPFAIIANEPDTQLKQIGEKILRKERILSPICLSWVSGSLAIMAKGSEIMGAPYLRSKIN